MDIPPNIPSSDGQTCQMEVDGGPEQRAFMAENKKAAGNTAYKNKNYKEALSLYTDAIELCPECAAYYGNRSATLMMLGRYKEALDDAIKSTTIDAKFVKGYIRQAKCLIALGDVIAAEKLCVTVLESDPHNGTVREELQVARGVIQFEEAAAKDIEKGDFRRALFCVDRCLQKCPQCIRFKVKKAEALALLRRYPEAQELASDVLQRDNMNVDAYYIRGLCLYYEDNIDKAFQHFQRTLHLAPDHKKAHEAYKKAKSLKQIKEQGNEAFRSGKFQEACDIYTDALNVDPLNVYTNSKLYCNRATANSKIKKLEEAIADCTKAIELDEKYLKAYLRRAKCYLDSEQYEEAVRDYETVCKMDKTRENKKLLDDAKLELKKSKRKDYYKVLGVNKEASDSEIKKAYRKRALIHHPDRHSGDSPEKQKEEETKFKEVGEAYSILSDPKKRARYDSGQDLEEMDGFGHVDPNNIFQMFFGGAGGPGGFSFGGGHGGHSHGGFHQQGFPGGFHFQF